MASLAGRLRWHLFRSPLAPTIKTLRTVRARAAMQRRARLWDKQAVGPCAAEKAEQLRREGYAVLTDLLPVENLSALRDAAIERVDIAQHGPTPATAAGVTAKPFWVRLLDTDMEGGRMRAASPFVQFALQPELLQFLTAALGQLPVLDYVLLTLSRHSAAPLSSSQLWHRDHDDTRTLKIFVYLTDVASRDDGPFTFLPGRVSDRFGYSLRSHRDDQAIFRRVSPDAKIEMIAPALSVFAVETSRCLHMGSRVAQDHERLLYTATFTSFPRLRPMSSRFILSGNESEIERNVLKPEFSND